MLVCVCVCVSSIVVYRKSPYTPIPIPPLQNKQTLSHKHTHPYLIERLTYREKEKTINEIVPLIRHVFEYNQRGEKGL